MLDTESLRAGIISAAGDMGASTWSGGGGAMFDADAGFDCPVCAIWVTAFILLFAASLLLVWFGW